MYEHKKLLTKWRDPLRGPPCFVHHLLHLHLHLQCNLPIFIRLMCVQLGRAVVYPLLNLNSRLIEVNLESHVC